MPLNRLFFWGLDKSLNSPDLVQIYFLFIVILKQLFWLVFPALGGQWTEPALVKEAGSSDTSLWSLIEKTPPLSLLGDTNVHACVLMHNVGL